MHSGVIEFHIITSYRKLIYMYYSIENSKLPVKNACAAQFMRQRNAVIKPKIKIYTLFIELLVKTAVNIPE